MRNSIIAIIFVVTIQGLLSCEKEVTTESSYETIKAAFLNPPQSAKPKVYWWCLNGNIDTIRAKEELLEMKEAGIGGFDLFEIGVPKSDKMIPGGPAFLSDESLEIIKCVIKEAGKLDLTVGLNLASSWNAGGSWIKPEHGGKSLYRSKTKITGNDEAQVLKIPFPEVTFPSRHIIGEAGKPMIPFLANGKPVYYEEVALLAIPADIPKHELDTSQIINITSFFDSETDLLEWNIPDGDWEIHRYICSNSGQQLVLPSPMSAGLTVDHFDSTAVEFHLNYIINRLKPVLGDFRETALKSFYLASYEARGFVWTSTMIPEFINVNGYDISKFIPSLFEHELFSPEINAKVQADFKKTLSELMINNLYKKSKEICNKHGLKINCEAGGPGFPLYNGPAEPLKALGNLDIPRGEFWINHSRNYVGSNGKDSIDILRVVKEVSAASHIYEKGIVEEEAFTSFQHWQEGPGDMKPFGDRAFCEGMNRVVFHGFSHNPTGSGYPGYVYHAGTHFNDKRVWWPKARPFIEYCSRISAVFQETDFVADVVWYYGDKIPNSATPKNTHFSVGPGYDYEVINTEILLNNLSVKDGKLTLTNRAEFSILALENELQINPNVLIKLKKLIENGAVIVGEKPSGISEVNNSPLTKDEGTNLINRLWENEQILSEADLTKLLEKMNVPPDFSYADKETFLIDFIHYKKENTDFYFIANTSDKWISREFKFRQSDKIPEVWEPVSGKISVIANLKQEGMYIKIPLTLAPYGSQLIVLKKGARNLNSDKISPSKNSIREQGLDGPWKVHFSKDWGAPEETTFQELISWTNSETEGIKYFSGTATYNKSFQFENGVNENQKVYLDLGEISKVGEVWLNDQDLGITWTFPHKFEITDVIKNGENNLLVEVANVWSNRLIGDAVTGEEFTNSNIKNTIVAVEGMKPGSQARIPWKDVPLIESGLLGPVTINVVEVKN